MDFGTIRKKLNLNIYKDVQQFLNDMSQVFINCRLYNGTESPVGKIGVNIRREYDRLLGMYNFVERFQNSQQVHPSVLFIQDLQRKNVQSEGKNDIQGKVVKVDEPKEPKEGLEKVSTVQFSIPAPVVQETKNATESEQSSTIVEETPNVVGGKVGLQKIAEISEQEIIEKLEIQPALESNQIQIEEKIPTVNNDQLEQPVEQTIQVDPPIVVEPEVVQPEKLVEAIKEESVHEEPIQPVEQIPIENPENAGPIEIEEPVIAQPIQEVAIQEETIPQEPSQPIQVEQQVVAIEEPTAISELIPNDQSNENKETKEEPTLEMAPQIEEETIEKPELVENITTAILVSEQIKVPEPTKEMEDSNDSLLEEKRVRTKPEENEESGARDTPN